MNTWTSSLFVDLLRRPYKSCVSPSTSCRALLPSLACLNSHVLLTDVTALITLQFTNRGSLLPLPATLHFSKSKWRFFILPSSESTTPLLLLPAYPGARFVSLVASLLAAPPDQRRDSGCYRLRIVVCRISAQHSEGIIFTAAFLLDSIIRQPLPAPVGRKRVKPNGISFLGKDVTWNLPDWEETRGV